MKILLTNDDGIHAEGINTLYTVLSREHDVYMFAPHEEKSACSNALSIWNSIRVDFCDTKRFAVYGYPADCVNIGIHSELCPDIDLVVSGINHGPNLGDDIHYSGTVAGARSGLIFGKHSIAVSINTHSLSENLVECSEYVLSFIDTHPILNFPDPVCTNINYPDLPADRIAGVKLTRQGRRSYIDTYSIIDRSSLHVTFQLKGDVISDFTEDTDTGEITRNYITLTPLQLDSTNHTVLQQLSDEK
ncbi:MAG: 5'/3'-nucleotidase SurE [Spirochaetota bacterium]